MRFWKSMFITTIVLFLASCANVSPTPLLMGQMDDLNTEVLQLYVDCSEEANYVPTKEGCDSELLHAKTKELLDLSEEFIRADIYQPQGYDVHLSISMIYFRISEGTASEYTRAEQISRQFFEVQKATGGHSLTPARFYFVWFTASNAAYQYFNDSLALNQERKAELQLALAEGKAALPDLEGPKALRLIQALDNLSVLIETIENIQ